MDTTWCDDTLISELIEFRHRLHAMPYHGFNVKPTAELVEQFLADHGVRALHTGLAGSGMLFRIEGRGGSESETKRLLFRCELDGLPILESNPDLEYRSQHHGCHHGCGHDGHMVMLIGTLVALTKHSDEWNGHCFCVFQPAEESGEGAKAVLQDLMERDPHILDGVVPIALHNIPETELGAVLVRKGVIACGSTGIEIELAGATSHASQPQLGRNPIPSLSRLAILIENLPAVMSKPPFNHAKHPLTLTALVQLDAGRLAFGTSAGYGVLRATIRSADHKILEDMQALLVEKAEEEARNGGFQLTYRFVEPFPATMCYSDSVDRFMEAIDGSGTGTRIAVTILGDSFPWSEDFAYFTAQCQSGLLFGFGSGVNQPPLHSPQYDFPDEIVKIGVELWIRVMTGWRV